MPILEQMGLTWECKKYKIYNKKYYVDNYFIVLIYFIWIILIIFCLNIIYVITLIMYVYRLFFVDLTLNIY